MTAMINRYALLFVLLAFVSATGLQAQQRSGKRSQYDPATVVSLTGTVETISQQNISSGWSGTHVSLKTTEDGLIDVHLGPTPFLAEQGLTVTAGQKIEVTGSKIKYQNTDALIARTVKVGEKTFELRDEQGYPKWSRSRWSW
jgi:hypothetical protein